MQLLETRLADVQHQLAESQRRAANPVIDEATLASALGSQSAAILRAAHEEAGRVTAEAQERAAAVFTQSQERAAAHVIDAQERAAATVTDAEATASKLEEDARAASQRLIDSAKVNGEALVERAREQGRAIVLQSQEARRAVLNDLAVKRKALNVQIEQLRAARDSLHESITAVRASVEGVLSGLMSSDEGARAAAIDALRNRPAASEPSEDEVLASVPLREVPDLELPPLEAALENPVAPTPRNESTGASSDEPSGADVVEEIFARLRRATAEEKPTPAPSKRAAAVAAPTPTGEFFARRDDSLASAAAQLTRKFKRALQDDQNVMIERLRGVSGLITTEFEDEFVQRARYVDAVRDALRDAASAGAKFAATETGHGGPIDEFATIDDGAADVAVTVVVALRRKILAEGNGDGADRANVAYKEWRGARSERLCLDAARRAFNAGVVLASSGRSVRFVASMNDAPCDACARDAAAGERYAGESFPSGQSHPPLHAGCACAVMPV